ncbi:MAG: hypothetical protein V3V41_02160 [Candidatus Heimdallarchaeota archaeon]
MHLSLLDTRPFNKFVEMELERDNLYKSFTTLDEPEEISTSWIIFAESCSQNLSVINSLADMAVERIHEVYMSILEDKDNPLALHELLYGDLRNQLMALNQFELQLGVLTYVYSQVRNTGVFNFSPSTSQFAYYITSKESIDTILYRILNDELPEIEKQGLTPSPTSNDLLQVILPLVQLENLKRLIPIYDGLPESAKDPKILSKRGEYDYLQGVTLLTHILDIAKKASQDFWWADPISELSILSHAKEHFESTIEIWNKVPETLGSRAIAIQMEFLPIIEAYSSIALVHHFKLLAQNAMESGDLTYASKYYKEALKEFKKTCKILEASESKQSKTIHESIQPEESELQILYSITELALKYTEVVNCVYDQNNEKAIEYCLEISKLLEDIEGAGSLPYIYGVSVIYSSALMIINELLEKDVSHLNVIDRLMSQFNFPLKAMSSAIDEIHLSFLKVDDENPIKSLNRLQELDEKLSYLEKAIELLPPFLSEKDARRHKIHAMRYYVKSIISENKIYIFADNNIVLDLILRARAHYFAKKAEQSISEIKKPKKDIKDFKKIINERMIETKVVGLITESSLVSLGLQSTYKKNIRDYIEEIISVSSEVDELPDFIADSVEKQFQELKEFHELLDLIMMDTQELIVANKEASIKGNEINWDFVHRRKAFIPAIKKMFEAIKSVILGELYSKIKKSSKGISNYTNAGDLFYEVSEMLGKVVNYLDEQKELPQLVYTMSLFSRENAKSIRDRRKRQEVPYQEMVSTLDYLILNL